MAKQPDSIQEYKRVLSEIESGKLKPVYFISGAEQFLIDKLQDAFIEFMPKEIRDFNLDLLYGQEVTPDKVLNIARSYPMMSEFRMLIVRDFLKLFDTRDQDTEGGKGSATADDFVAYVKNPNPSCITIFISDKRPAKNTKLGKALFSSSHATICELESVSENQLPVWIHNWVKSEHKKTIDSAAAQMLAYSVGSDLQKLSTEIDKLCTYKTTGEEITQEDVKKMVGVSREFSVFELQDALISRNLDKTLTVAEHILQQADSVTGEVIKTTGFLYGTFSKVWQIQSLRNKGMSPDQISKAVGAYGFYLNKLTKMAQAYPPQKMPEIFEILLDADRAIKGFSRVDSESILLISLKKIIL